MHVHPMLLAFCVFNICSVQETYFIIVIFQVPIDDFDVYSVWSLRFIK